ncbi:uncharacterized protein LOC113136948 [Mastacembelus armatus]|uniref:uncharacterized protein LOC113136948 n=1 Tax=Mastacembelus armatus TaxID=205130 RepID=UPI000E461DF6|nr:uncharacterized protein LOC113136948 [Mastacembelus armatus]XP_026173925.1 uncharacterized protein LOC113136948 [Mastacembelus armatus]
MMDTRDICSLKDKTKMDTNTVWQWRIMLAKKYSRYLEPLCYSSKMGLDFNVGSNTQEKLDFHSVSNGVILEICDFAKIINRSKGHVITNILENNFDLGLKNDQERTDFAAQILHKVRELIKEPPKNKYDVFPLFDTSSEHQCTGSSKTGVNNMASREHKTNCWLVEIYDIDNTEDESELGSQIPFEDYIKTEEKDGSHVDSLNGDEFESSRPQSVEELKEDVLPTSLPYCEEVGLKLDVGSKQSLDPCLITKGMMLELVHFTRVLTSYNSIVLGVLEHNFEIDVKSQQGKNKVWFKVLNLLKSRKQLFGKFKNEPFSFQNDSFKKGTALFSVGAQLDGFKKVTKRRQSDVKIKGGKRALSPTGEHTTKRSRRESSEQKQANIMSHDTDLCTSQTAEDDRCYMSLLDPDEVTDSDNGENELQNPGSSDIPRESESSPLRVCTPLLTTTHASSSLPIVNLNINTPLACQPDKRGRCGGEEEPQMPTNVQSECHVEQEEMEIESNMWKLRASQVKQILLHDENCAFNKSKKHGIEFNVGFGPKQNIDVDSLTNVLLLEVAKFALAMNSSQQDFIMEILEYNFDLGLQSEYHRKIFACDLMTRVRQLQNSEDTVKFSRQIFELPGLVSSGNITNESMDIVNPELSSISREAECDVAPMCPLDSHTEAKEHIDLYRFCKDIGLKLHVNHSRPNKKLEISKLTHGAMTEVTVFAEKLCGTFEQICLDIIRHNFDLDAQSGDSDQARNILMQIPLAMEQKHLLTCISSSNKYKRKLLVMENLECQNSPNVEPSSTSSYQAPITDQNIGSCTDTEQEHEVDLGLWKLRANQIQQLLSVPHGENCPLYSYSKCRKVGLDFNVGSGVKQNLDPKLLTNGIMVEIHTFATALISAEKEFITEILEYNFHLDLKSELHRSVFAQKIMNNVKASALKCNKIRLMNLPFELPDSRCIEESSYPKAKYCPKCYKERSSNLHQDVSDPGHELHPHPHTKADTVCAEPICSAQSPAENTSSTSPTAAETMMVNYPRCKKIGLTLCLNEDQPKDKLSTQLLTRGVVNEVARYAKKLCGTRIKIINDIIKHNFNFGMQSRNINPAEQFSKILNLNNKRPNWFNEVFVVQPCSHKDPRDVSKVKKVSVMQKTGSKETIKKRQLALQTKRESTTVPRDNMTVVKRRQTDFKSEWEPRALSPVSQYFAEAGRWRDILFQSDDHCFMSPLDSDELTDSDNGENEDELQNRGSSDIPRESESSPLRVCTPLLTTTHASSSLPIVNLNINTPLACQPDKRGRCGGEEEPQMPTNVQSECHVEQEEMEIESNMWKLRASQVKQILLHDENCAFNKSKKHGIEFNVGFGPKQNIDVDSLTNVLLLEVAKFALAMNSSQQDFIMEILEYNFDLGLQSEYHRKIFACDLMTRVRQLQNSEDTVKFSRQIFELPGLVSSGNITNESMDIVNPELSSISREAECDVAPMCPLDSHTEAKEHIDLYRFCKDIGLKLHVNHSRPNKKLEISKLTHGAMTEVTVFAEKLCGTFEQICLDIIRHNFDLDAQSGDSDQARNILMQIPLAMEQKHLLTCISSSNKYKRKLLVMENLECQNSPNVEPSSTSSYQAPITDQNIGSCTDTEQEHEVDLGLWKLRANQIQQLLSVPHGENCPLYSYSKCRKVGLDFNVGSGVKQNLDPKLLTNGIMVEIHTFATALISAEKEFITEILEYNFHLDLKSELHRSVFAQKIMNNVKASALKCNKIRLMNLPFELPDSRCIEESSYPKAKYCPKCYKERSSNLHQDVSDPGHELHPHPHTKADTVCAEPICSAQSPAENTSSTSPTAAETMMVNYPRCKKIGLTLCLNEDQPKDKLSTQLLTRGVVNEVARYAKKLCGTRIKIINDIIKHNFNFGMQSRNINPAEQFSKILNLNNKRPNWFNEVFVVQPCSHKDPRDVSKVKKVSVMQKTGSKETIKKRQLALQTKRESTTVPRDNMTVVKRRQTDFKSEWEPRALSPVSQYFAEAGRWRDILFQSDDHCFMSPLDSDELTDSDNGENEDELQNPGSSDIPRESESSPLRVCTPLLTTTHASSSLPIVNLNINTPLACQPDKRGRCGGEEEPQMPTNVQSECHVEQEEMEIESNMWKLRASQVKQILLHDENCAFSLSKRHGIEFNVGFGPKQNIDVDSLTNVLLLEVAKFALAMNSSQQDFIMEILEYNFDLGLQSEYHRKIFACDLMTRVRQLQNSEDTVKFSRQIFELPGLVSSGNITNESMDIVNPELSSISREAECDVAPMCPLDSHTEAKEHIDLYRFCKDIGLKLHVNHSRPNKKLEISKLTHGAMTEVTVFAEKLCGTFEQICLDIIRHNFDLDAQSGDSDQARNILMQIPLAMEQKHLLTCISSSNKCKKKLLVMENMECKNSPNVEPSSTSSYQAPITDQNIGSCTDTEQEHEVDLGLWKLRANQIQQLLSVPHGENCPLYSYSKCRKVGLDFNVGSGVKQNLDPKLLTNGIMVEIHTFVTALISAEKEFITEILEYNFHLDLKSELHRSVFAQKIMNNVKASALKCNKIRLMNLPFELPDSRCIEESSYPKVKYCPKCYKERNSNLHPDVSDPGHELHPRPHTKANTVCAEPICSAQSPAENTSSTSTTAAETMMDNYPRCKKIGVTLCLNEDQPKDKLSTQLLTRGVVNEVARYAKKLCGTRIKIINDIIKHNFNFGMQSRDINPGEQFSKILRLHNKGPNWFSEVFVVQPSSKNLADVSKVKKVSVMQKNERKETFKKRQLALQTKKVRTTVPRDNMTVEKPKSKRPRGDCFPFCTEIGLDLDVTSKPKGKKKLDLKLLTKAVVMEIYRFVVNKKQHYFPSSLFDILDYNFDLSSQHDRKWEFALSTASKVKTMVRNYKTNRADVIFQLPFVLEHSSSKSSSQTKKSSMPLTDEPHKTTTDSKFMQTAVRYCSENPWWNVKDNTLTNPWAIMQMNDSPLRAGCDIPQGNIQIKEEEYEPNFGDMNLELDPEKDYHPYSEDAKTESNIVSYLAPGEPTGSLGHTLLTICPNYEINITGGSENAHFSMLAEPQASEGYAMHAVCPNTQSSEETTLSTESLKYLVPVQTAESQGYSVITICQDPQSIVIKEEQDNVPVDSSQYGLVSYTESGVDVKQE